MTATQALRRNIVSKRAELHLSQEALAVKAHVSRATVSKIEQGNANVTLANLEKIATELGCRLDELFAPRYIRVDDEELERRANAPDSDFVDARALENAIEEANKARRYSNAGRRPAKVDGRASS